MLGDGDVSCLPIYPEYSLQMPGNLVGMPTFCDTSPVNSFKSFESQDSAQLHDVIKITTSVKSQPTKELINSFDKGGHLLHPTPDPA